MKNSQKNLILSVFFIFSLIFISHNIALAEENKKTDTISQGCNLQENLDKLISLKEDNETPLEKKNKEELILRKNLLVQVIDCSSTESESLKNDLSKLNNLSETDEQIKTNFITSLNSFASHYQEIKDKVLNESSLEKIKDLAQETSDWREQNYNPKTELIMNFLLIFNENEMIATAEARYQKISTALKITGLNSNTKVKKLLAQASTSIAQAKKMHDEAHKNLINSLLVSTTEKSKEKIKETTPPSESLRNSLEKIKETYQKFFEISEVIKKISHL